MINYKTIVSTVCVAAITSVITTKLITNQIVSDLSGLLEISSQQNRSISKKKTTISHIHPLNSMAENDKSFLRVRLGHLFPKARIGDIELINDGFYLAQVDDHKIGIDSLGKTLFKGQIIDIKKVIDPTDFSKAKIYETVVIQNKTSNNKNLSSFKKHNISHGKAIVHQTFDKIIATAIHYPSLLTKSKLTVIIFGDITCLHCREMHKKIPTLRKNGIDIYYAPLSRSGPGTIADRIDTILCSKDPALALNDAMSSFGFTPSKQTRCKTQQAFYYHSALKVFHAKGTPAIYDRDGEQYSVSQLLALLPKA